MALIALVTLSSAATAVPDRPAVVERFLFELCPKVIAGEIDLTDRQQVEGLGLRIRPEARDWVEAQVGEKKKRITIGFRTYPGKRVCQVKFGGKDNYSLYHSVIRAGEARGWRSSGGAAELGGFISFLFPAGPGHADDHVHALARL